MDTRTQRLALAFLVSCMAGVFNVALAGECRLTGLQSDHSAPAPVLDAGTRWVYSVGEGIPVTTLALDSVAGGVANYTVNGNVTRNESIGDYALVNARREGLKQQLQFPLRVGAAWTDAFSEPGEVRGAFGTYRYDYQESATNIVTGVETIRIGVGEVDAYRVERIARWKKSNPVSVEMTDHRIGEDGEIVGVDKIVSWYAPAIGRVVLRSQFTVHPAWAAGTDIDSRSASTTVVELVEYLTPSGCDLVGTPVQAQLETAKPLGYKFRDNDTWEYRMSWDEHRPLMHDDVLDSPVHERSGSADGDGRTRNALERVRARLQPVRAPSD